MIDGLLVVDEYGFIVDMNTGAKEILAGLPAFVGGRFAEFAAAWPALAEVGADCGLKTVEAVRKFPTGNRFFRITGTTLQSGGHWLGKVIIIKDITQQRHDQTKMIEQQKALSIMTERERLRRELHDGQGQLWSYINMQVESIRSLLGKKDLAQADLLLEKLAGFTREVHVDIRETLIGLQHAANSSQGVWQTLEEYLQWFEQSYGLNTELIISSEFAAGLLAPTTEVQLLRIIQEALTNIRKYAGARNVKVVVKVNDDLAEIRMEDDGCGFDYAAAAAKKGSFGLKIMKERADEVAAQFDVQSTPGAGTKVILQIPLAADVGLDLALHRNGRKEMRYESVTG